MSQQKTGLMYVPASAAYKAGDGYLCIPAEYSPWISTTDYYDTPERVTEAHALLERSGLLAKLVPIAPRPATPEELTGFHSAAYIEKLQRLSAGEGGLVGEYCRIGHGGLDVIAQAVGGDLVALDEVMARHVRNAFCLQRPPGAHAERESGFGFCVVNDFNILIQRAREKYGLKRIMLIDFDNHYKNGIEQAWYDTDEVLYAETHQSGAMRPTKTPTISARERDKATMWSSPCLPAPVMPPTSRPLKKSSSLSPTSTNRNLSSLSPASRPISSTRWGVSSVAQMRMVSSR